jgi:hypothetical protein
MKIIYRVFLAEISIFLYDLFYKSFSNIFIRIQKNVYAVLLLIILCTILVNFYLSVILYGEYYLRKLAIAIYGAFGLESHKEINIPV